MLYSGGTRRSWFVSFSKSDVCLGSLTGFLQVFAQHFSFLVTTVHLVKKRRTFKLPPWGKVAMMFLAQIQFG